MNTRLRLMNGMNAFLFELSKPNSFLLGEAFEDYVDRVLFPKDRYTLIRKSPSYSITKNKFVESALEPDFFYRISDSDQKFYVEAKFRNFTKDAIQLCSKNQFERFKAIDENEYPILIALGLGGNPTNPKMIYLYPMSELQSNIIDDYEDEFEYDGIWFYRNKPVYEGYLRKLLYRQRINWF